jgi:hypothetical protein
VYLMPASVPPLPSLLPCYPDELTQVVQKANCNNLLSAHNQVATLLVAAWRVDRSMVPLETWSMFQLGEGLIRLHQQAQQGEWWLCMMALHMGTVTCSLWR